MATDPIPVPITPDDAFNAFKALESRLVTDQGTQTSAHDALDRAQKASDAADQAVYGDISDTKTVATQLIAAIQAYVDSLPPVPQPQP